MTDSSQLTTSAPPLRRDEFLYDLPESAIAQSAVEPRDSSRLLDTVDMSDHRFSDLPDLLQPGDLVVVNRTKVRRARLAATRVDTGGSIELLVLGTAADGAWEALCRPARRLRPGIRLRVADGVAEIVDGPVDGRVRVRFEGTGPTEAEAWFEEVGDLPLPPYFHGSVDPERYQTVFATTVGSAAAPTAALHFTSGLLADLPARGVALTEVELRVGLDTFRPISVDLLSDHKMHTEQLVVPERAARAVTDARARGGRVIAVGTTVVRTLESSRLPGGLILPGERSTDLFITPGYEFGVIDGLITNFHVPGSTLTVLIAAVLGERWRSVYRHALEHGYRFLSFGDAMYADVARIAP